MGRRAYTMGRGGYRYRRPGNSHIDGELELWLLPVILLPPVGFVYFLFKASELYRTDRPAFKKAAIKGVKVIGTVCLCGLIFGILHFLLFP